MKQNYEFGRSMVEMLGTLAIVGVLSIGGITGYNYAINKYRANETINEINMRLMTLQTQSERDMDLNLNEFADKTPLGYMIGDNYGWAEDDTRVYVGVSGIPQGACEIIYDEMITKVERIDVTADRMADINTLCGDNNEMKFYVGSGVEVSCDPPCADDEYCMSGIKCVKKWKVPSIACTSENEAEVCGECSKCSGSGWCVQTWKNSAECNNGNGICADGKCLPKEDIADCETNDDCPDNYYCALKSSGCNPAPYGCVPLNFSYIPVTMRDGTVEIWYKPNHYMTWLNAIQACAAMGKKMPSYAEWKQLGINPPGNWLQWTATRHPTHCNLAYTMNDGIQDIALSGVYASCR